MFDVIKVWIKNYFSDPELVVLVAILLFGFILILQWGAILTPVIVSIVIAYLLHWVVTLLTSHGMPRLAAVVLVYLGFLGLFFGALLVLWPLAWRQLMALVADLPTMVREAQHAFHLLPEQFPEYLTQGTVDKLSIDVTAQIHALGRTFLTATITSIPSLIVFLIYLIMLPLMVFFFLKDGGDIRTWLTQFLPTHRPILHQVWEEVDLQTGNYVRGKVAECFIVATVTYFLFFMFEMPYALLLSVIVGLSVFVPYVGAVVVTVPVVLVAYFQWGLEPTFAWLMFWYLLIHALDANVLIPLLFSEAVNLHPIAIIVAILVFGGLWGFWGAFFAIPLATLIKTVLNAWPKKVTA